MTPGTSASTDHNTGSFDTFLRAGSVLSHYRQYFEERSRIAQRDIFLVFSSTWLSSLERASLWIAGFNPGFALKFVCNSVQDLSPEQSERIKRLMEGTRYEERVLNEELARIQESIASPPLVEIARKRAQMMNVETAAREEAELVTLRKAVEEVVAGADLLRMTIAMKVVEILNPAQNVRFLTDATQLLVKLRNSGLQKDAERKKINSDSWI
ncbi:hypothetical protein PTKIN_Ptkin13bG0295500 [Pterospermum kingtungense]